MAKPADRAEFELMASYVRTLAEAFIREQFGERCPGAPRVTEAECEVCSRWEALDRLLVNPWEDSR